MITKRWSAIFAALAWASLILVCVSPAPADVVPPNLSPGSEYQIIFLTHDTTTATSGDIGYYNNFVAQEAAMSSSLPAGVTWSAVASTTGVNAKVNAPTSDSIPIYTSSGQLVASGGSALWGALTNPLQNMVINDQYGQTWVMDAWTGTGSDGTAAGGGTNALGQWYTTTAYNPSNYVVGPEIGCGVFLNNGWVDSEPYSSNLGSSSMGQTLSLYALSSVSTVSPVPEPSMLVLLGTGAIASVGYVGRKRRAGK
jgi:hypothetical protein